MYKLIPHESLHVGPLFVFGSWKPLVMHENNLI